MLAPTWPLRPMVTRLPGRLIAAFHLAVDIQRFGAGDLALHKQALADHGLVAGRRWTQPLRTSTVGAGAGRCGSGLEWGLVLIRI
jgi:hypothetical protein